MSDGLGDRIKKYERASRLYATPRMPVIIRVDGKAFHTFTKYMEKPFDPHLIESMVCAAFKTANELQGCKVAYVQSDEVTFFLSDYDTLESQGWFDYNLSKMISISAATMTAEFIQMINVWDSPYRKPPVFDSRAFNVPKEDVVNTFLWRAKDWERNSLQMYCRSIFSHNELHGKNRDDMRWMLAEKKKSWFADLTGQEKHGTFIVNHPGDGLVTYTDVPASYEAINRLIGDLI